MTFVGNPQQRVLRLAAARGIQLIVLQFVDLLGGIKEVSIPVTVLPEVLARGMAADGSAVDGFTRLAEENVLLHPDAATFAMVAGGDGPPWGRLLCDLRHPDGSPFPGCGRHLLRRVLDQLAQEGLAARVQLEVEFFLFKADSMAGNGNGGEGGLPIPFDQTGYLDAADTPLIQQLAHRLAHGGCGVVSLHHEVAPGQYGITLAAADPLTAADRLVTCRRLVKEGAASLGAHATFMPKPLYGLNGSGLHIHQWLERSGENAFHDPNGPYGLTPLARHFVGGQLAHARGYSAVTNPLINSYKRLVPGYEAPVYIAWSQRNRSPFIRIPEPGTGPARVELRGPDPACNPYLALAVVLAAGLDGIGRQLEPPPPINRDLYELTHRERAELGIHTLPGSLGEAVEALLQDELILATLGDYVAERFIQAKQIEWDLYRTQVHRWEVEQYLTSF